MGSPNATRLHLDGVEWTLEAPHADRLAVELLRAVPDLASHPTARLIKRSLQRSVHRVELSGGQAVIVKVYHIRGWKERIKRLALGPKPRIEWDASRRLLALGVPASHAIAVGIPTPPSAEVEGYLIVEVLPDIVTLQAYLESLAATAGGSREAASRRLVDELAAFVRRLHDRGVSHHDLHRGNILVRSEPPSADERFLIIDLHRIGVGRPPGRRHRTVAIAQLVHGLAPDLAGDLASSVQAFLDAYSAAGPSSPRTHVSADSVLEAIERHASRRLRSRARRCLVNSSQFAVETLDGWRICHRRDRSAGDILALWAQHRQAAPPAVTRLPDGLELRQYPARGLLARLLGRSPGVSEYAAAHRAHLETGSGPEAIAAAECRAGPDRGRSFALLARGQASESR